MADLIHDIETIKEKEQERISQRRRAAGIPKGDPGADALGVGFSGGGIRSAAFNLGLLQALNKTGLFSRVDYLSTVSGGGYIGSSLTWFMARLGCDFPFGLENGASGQPWHPSPAVAWIRRHGNYLTPREGLGGPSLGAALLRGTFINLLVVLPILLLLFWGLTRLPAPGLWDRVAGEHFFDFFPFMAQAAPHLRNDLLTALFGIGLSVLLGLLPILFIVYAVNSRKNVLYGNRRAANVWLGGILRAGLGLLLFGSLPWVSAMITALSQRYDETAILLSILGGLGTVLGLGDKKDGKDGKSPASPILLGLGLALLVYGLLLWLYRLAIWIDWGAVKMGILFALVALSLFVGWRANINRVSMHRYYRDRLMEAFMPGLKDLQDGGLDRPGACSGELGDRVPDQCMVALDPETVAGKAPYQIINTNLHTRNSRDTRLALRLGDNFVFTPDFAGAQSTGWLATNVYMGGEMSLATAFAISGAAVDPNSDQTTSGMVAFLMTLLNFRLGFWAPNPAKEKGPVPYQPAPWFRYVHRELLGVGLSEAETYINLSDGGHFENLAAYELIRRRCPFIILSDAGADPDWTFVDIGNLAEKVRVDFGVRIDIDTDPLDPGKHPVKALGKARISRRPFVTGMIHYPDGGSSRLLYLKTCFTGTVAIKPNARGETTESLPQDIIAYRTANPSFPDQTTADQFFDEAQFEAYRELGYRYGKWAFTAYDGTDASLAQVFDQPFKPDPKEAAPTSA